MLGKGVAHVSQQGISGGGRSLNEQLRGRRAEGMGKGRRRARPCCLWVRAQRQRVWLGLCQGRKDVGLRAAGRSMLLLLLLLLLLHLCIQMPAAVVLRRPRRPGCCPSPCATLAWAPYRAHGRRPQGAGCSAATWHVASVPCSRPSCLIVR